MDKETLKLRTKEFALRVMKLARAMPKDSVAKVIAGKLIRSATSVGANFRSACRGRSRAEWLSKIGICLEEADESAYWLELIMEDNILPKSRIAPLWKEADELCAIFYTAMHTAKRESGKC